MDRTNRLGFKQLKEQVIDRGLCTLCGTCVGVCPKRCLALNSEDLEVQIVERSPCAPCGICTAVCPGADVPIRELERFVFGRSRTDDEDMGVFTSCGSAISTDSEIRKGSASGGLATALLVHALESGLIDCAVATGFRREAPWQPEAVLCTNRQEILSAAQSKYSPAPANTLLQEAVRQGHRHIGLIGCPCHVHAIRKMQRANVPSKVASAIKLSLGLLCGCGQYFEGTRHILYEWCGVKELKDIAKLEYRGGPWPQDNLVVTLKGGEQQRIPRLQYVLSGLSQWGRDRCMMCLDWAAELADVSIGDYWGPIRSPEERRRSTFLIRTRSGDELMKDAETRGVISLEAMKPEWFAASAGYEFKKHTCAFRWNQRRMYGWPVPDFHFLPDHSPTDNAQAGVILRNARIEAESGKPKERQAADVAPRPDKNGS